MKRLFRWLQSAWWGIKYSAAGDLIAYFLAVIFAGVGIAVALCVALRVVLWIAPLFGFPLNFP